jgi:hypothetical protein
MLMCVLCLLCLCVLPRWAVLVGCRVTPNLDDLALGFIAAVDVLRGQIVGSPGPFPPTFTTPKERQDFETRWRDGCLSPGMAGVAQARVHLAQLLGLPAHLAPLVEARKALPVPGDPLTRLNAYLARRYADAGAGHARVLQSLPGRLRTLEHLRCEAVSRVCCVGGAPGVLPCAVKLEQSCVRSCTVCNRVVLCCSGVCACVCVLE